MEVNCSEIIPLVSIPWIFAFQLSLDRTEREGNNRVKKSGKKLNPGANVLKLFTAVIYFHLKVMLSFCVMKLHYHGNDCGMTVNYHGKKPYNIRTWWQT